jgi:hypothetical protein
MAKTLMPQEEQKEILDTLREIRDGQREVIQLLSAQRTLAEEQLKKSGERIAESVGLQRLALQRQRTITLIAIPALLACIAAIAYLVLRYF